MTSGCVSRARRQYARLIATGSRRSPRRSGGNPSRSRSFRTSWAPIFGICVAVPAMRRTFRFKSCTAHETSDRNALTASSSKMPRMSSPRRLAIPASADAHLRIASCVRFQNARASSACGSNARCRGARLCRLRGSSRLRSRRLTAFRAADVPTPWLRSALRRISSAADSDTLPTSTAAFSSAVDVSE